MSGSLRSGQLGKALEAQNAVLHCTGVLHRDAVRASYGRAAQGGLHGWPVRSGRLGEVPHGWVRYTHGVRLYCAGHVLHVWSVYSGRLEKVLEARASAAAAALAPHPKRHLLAAATSAGQARTPGSC